MTLTDEIKILNDEIKKSQSQCNLEKKAAGFSALLSK